MVKTDDSLDDEFWASRLEDEPCSSCETRPSYHHGHGFFVCKPCYDSWWCPECRYRLKAGHVCFPGFAVMLDGETKEVGKLTELEAKKALVNAIHALEMMKKSVSKADSHFEEYFTTGKVKEELEY